MKKRLCTIIMLSLALLICASYEGGFIYAEQSGDYSYTVSSGNAIITRYSGPSLDVNIPSSLNGHIVVGIGDYVFRDYESLASITIPDSVTSIGYSAFSGCSSLTSITIPDSVTSIGSSAFSDCSSLTSITIPDSMTYIGSSAFWGCGSLASITIPEGISSIEYSTFKGCSSLTSITISEGVTSIGDSAFYDCSNLTDITIPDSVTSIGNSAFWGCDGLASITIPENVTSIGNSAFWGCNNLTEFHIPNIQAWIQFQNFAKLGGEKRLYIDGKEPTNIIIPESIANIGDYAFSGCSSLMSITIPDNVTSVGKYAFYECRNLSSVSLSKNMTSIEECAFARCESLKDLLMPEGIITIGKDAFSNCSALQTLVIPDSVTNIDEWAFFRCSSLRNLTISNNLEEIKDCVFGYCRSLTDVTIPKGVKRIGDASFNYCTSLTHITVPDTVTSIGSGAFNQCSLIYADFYGDAPELISDPVFTWTEGYDLFNSGDIYHRDNFCIRVSQDASGWTFPKWNYYNIAYRGLSPEDNTALDINGYNRNGVLFELDEATLTAAVSSFIGNDSGIVIIPKRVIKDGMRYTVTSIDSRAFRGNKLIKSLVIGQDVETISASAFYGCNNLNSVSVDPNNQHFTVENNILYNKDNTTIFFVAKSVSSVTVPRTVTKINRYAFEGCNSLRSIIIPDNVTNIEAGVFANCIALESLTLPFVGEKIIVCDNSQYPFGYLFERDINYYNYDRIDNTPFTAVEQYFHRYSSDSVISDTYYIPSSLRSVTVTGGKLYYGAFYNCNMIEEITLGKDVEFTGERAFYGCSSLERINVNKKNPELASDSNGVLYSKDYKTIKCYPSGKKNVSYQIDSRVEAIEPFAFYNCLNLESLYVPDTVTDIPMNSIAYYDLTMFVYRGSAAETYAQTEEIAYKYIGETKAKNVRVMSEYGLPVIASGEENASVVGDYDGVSGVVDGAEVNYNGKASGLQTVTVTYNGETIQTKAVVYDPDKETFHDFGDVVKIDEKTELGIAGMYNAEGRFLGLSPAIVLEEHKTVLIPNEVYEDAVEAKLMVVKKDSFAPAAEAVEEGL